MNDKCVKQIMLAVARKAGDILLKKSSAISVTKKGRIDLVTQADKAAEAAIVASLTQQFPDDSFITEETSAVQGRSEYTWIIDPLDGTSNYVHGLPIYAVSIALARQTEIIAGVVFNPAANELFSAFKDEGATLNGMPVFVSTTQTIADAMLVTGFSYDLRDIFDVLIERFQTCLFHARGIRRFGSAALDLCYVASGRFDGFWEQRLKPWDTAAGLIIAREAGAMASDFSGNAYNPFLDEILVTNGHIHEEMLTLLNLQNKETII